jgi:hypothetical protein
MSLGQSLADAFAAGDPGLPGPRLLNRVQVADGLALHVGRDAAVAWLAGLSAAFEERTAHVLAEAGAGALSAVALLLRGRPVRSPWPFAACEEVTGGHVELLQHLWIRTEAGRAVDIEAIADWSGLAAVAGFDADRAAAHLGQTHPCHRPLGELASGRGQLMEDGDDAAGLFNARRLGGDPAFGRLVAAMPDARLTADKALPGATLWRLQGHVAGRRMSLPVSRIGEGALLWDGLALAASAHRPFWPE